MKVPITCALAFSGIAAATATCYADTITTFDVSATLQTGTLGGTINVDETLNEFSSSDITAPGTGSGPFTKLNSFHEDASLPVTEFVLGDAVGYTLFLEIPASLFGYTGGPICSSTALCGTLVSNIEPINNALDDVVVGSLSLPAGAPGPIIGSGLPGLMLAGAGLLAWRRAKGKSHSVALAAA